MKVENTTENFKKQIEMEEKNEDKKVTTAEPKKIKNAKKSFKKFKKTYTKFVSEVQETISLLKENIGNPELIKFTCLPYQKTIIENEGSAKFFCHLKYKISKGDKSNIVKIKFFLNGRINVTLRFHNRCIDDIPYKKITLAGLKGKLGEITEHLNAIV